MTRFVLFLSITACVTSICAASCSSEDTSSRLARTSKRRAQTDPVTGQALPDYNDIHVTTKEGLPDPLEGLLKGEEQLAALCARSAVDSNKSNLNSVTNMFCKENKRPTSITELLGEINLGFTKRDASGTNGSNQNPGFALLSHTQSVLARSTSAINPRAFVFSPAPGVPTKLPGFSVMAFVRGDSFLEIAAQDQGGTNIRFYLVKFNLTCEPNCQPQDLLTPAVESNWAGITAYDDEDLKNTILDCRECHQISGPGSGMMLRMQELEDPWTHWMKSDNPGGLTLLQDFARAHGENEDYAGIPGALIQKSDGRAIEDLVKGQGFTNQANQFPTKVVEAEVKATTPSQPEQNTPRGKSATWEQLFQASFTGQFIPPPYHDVKVTDPDKLDFATKEYAKFMAGGGNVLPDIRRVFLDDALEDMVFLSRSGASGREVLVQTCAQCHNPNLDLSISRAKFDISKLDSMSRADKDNTIARLRLPNSDRLHMPPALMRSLPDDARDAAINFLKQ